MPKLREGPWGQQGSAPPTEHGVSSYRPSRLCSARRRLSILLCISLPCISTLSRSGLVTFQSLKSLGSYNFANVQGHALTDVNFCHTKSSQTGSSVKIVCSQSRGRQSIFSFDQCCVAEVSKYIGLPTRLDWVDAYVPPHQRGTTVDVFNLKWEKEMNGNFRDNTRTGSVDVHSNLRTCFSLIHS